MKDQAPWSLGLEGKGIYKIISFLTSKQVTATPINTSIRFIAVSVMEVNGALGIHFSGNKLCTETSWRRGPERLWHVHVGLETRIMENE